MDQDKIGKFIAECRKQQQLTQAGLAEQLGITDRAVSKWETGKNLPDASIMLKLCEILDITVNELLTGEHIVMEDYRKTAEENLVAMKQQEEQANKKLLSAETFLTTMAVIAAVALSIVGALFAEVNNTAGLIICLSGTAIAVVCAVYAVTIEHDAGYYECPHCGCRYRPAMKAVILAPHIGKSRKMRCPQCESRGYHKKVLTK